MFRRNPRRRQRIHRQLFWQAAQIIFGLCLSSSTALALLTVRVQAAADRPTILMKLDRQQVLPTTLMSIPITAALGVIEIPIPPKLEPTAYLEWLRRQPDIVWAELNTKDFVIQTTPNDGRYPEQTGLVQLAMPAAWNDTTGLETVRVGIIDTGIDSQHEDLVNRVDSGFNFVSNTPISPNTTSDENGHGTAVAGVIGAQTNNTTGIAGMDWRARLVPLRVTDAQGEATASQVANAIIYAADQGIRLVNLSLGTASEFQVITDAIAYATTKGTIIVAAAGNENGPLLYPARYPAVFAVGSLNAQDFRSSFSNFGPELDVMAPGENILSTSLSGTHNTYSVASGTSLATPFVTGLVSLMLARHPAITPDQLGTAFRNYSDKVAAMGGQTFTETYGYGKVNPARTLVGASDYQAQLSIRSGNLTVLSGEAGTFVARFTNTGVSTWRKNQVFLGEARPFGRNSVFTQNGAPLGWVAMQEESVPPGGMGTFIVTLTAPSTLARGTYREYFALVADGVTWLTDPDLSWDVTVAS